MPTGAFFACRADCCWDRQRSAGDAGTAGWLVRLKWRGAIAQLGERYNGIVEVSGSIPLSSTNRTKPPDGGFFVGGIIRTKTWSGGDSQIFKRVPEFGFLGGVSKGIR